MNLYLGIGIIVFLLSFEVIAVASESNSTISGSIISIQPDTQITYNKIVILDNEGYSFSQDVSCTGNFQFIVNQTVSISQSFFLGFRVSENLNGLPAGCISLK